MLIYVNGFMGSGKTTLLDEWRHQWGGECFDFDHKLALNLGIEAGQLGEWIEAQGWDKFRSLETDLLAHTLEQERGLYAVGGGTLANQHNLSLVRQHKQARIVWLKTPVEECWRRVREDTHRPLVKQGHEAFVRLYKERLAYYRQCDLAIEEDTDFKAVRGLL